MAKALAGLDQYPSDAIKEARSSEIAAVRSALASNRLVSVVGPAGIGTSSVARLALTGSDGWYFPARQLTLDLSTIETPELVRIGLMHLGLLPRAHSFEGFRQVLLIDGCDQLLEETRELVEEILNTPADITVVTAGTSNLGLRGQSVIRLGPLATPSTADQFDTVLGNVSFRILLEAAGTLVQQVDSTSLPIEAYVSLCHLAEGNPSALRLAGGLLRVYGHEAVVGAIESSGPVDGALNRFIECAVHLMSPEQRAGFRGLGALSVHVSLAAYASVLGGLSGQATELLNFFARLRLVEKVPSDDLGQYRTPRSVVRIARELTDAAEGARYASARAHYYVDFVQVAVEGLHEPNPLPTLQLFEWEQPNWRMVLDSVLKKGLVDEALLAATALAEFWWHRPGQIEAEYWFDRLIPECDSIAQDDLLSALICRGRARGFNQHPEGSISDLRRALAIARRGNDRIFMAIALTYLGWQEVIIGDGSGSELLNEALHVWKALGRRAPAWRVAETHSYIGRAEFVLGRCERAILHLRIAFREFERLGFERYAAGAAIVISGAYLCNGPRNEVRDSARSALATALGLEDSYLMAQTAEVTLGLVNPPLNSATNAILMAIRDALIGVPDRGTTMLGLLVPGLTISTRRRAAIAHEEYSRSLAMKWPEQASYIQTLIDSVKEDDHPSPAHTVEAITVREVTILQKMASGLTDIEIERELDISGRTLRRLHASLFQKLGASTRTHAIALAAREGLLEDNASSH